MAGLSENRQPRTPEQVKKDRAKAIRDYAMEIYPGLYAQASALANPKMPPGEEDRLAFRRQVASATAESSIVAAEVFFDTWKKRKGKYLHDDA